MNAVTRQEPVSAIHFLLSTNLFTDTPNTVVWPATVRRSDWPRQGPVTPSAVPLAVGTQHGAVSPELTVVPLAVGTQHSAVSPKLTVVPLAVGTQHGAVSPQLTVVPLAVGTQHSAVSPKLTQSRFVTIILHLSGFIPLFTSRKLGYGCSKCHDNRSICTKRDAAK
jgi:hypothetical protein